MLRYLVRQLIILNALCTAGIKYLVVTEAVRDLIKFLRRDGDDHEIRRFLGAANIVETDLLPIIVEYTNKSELFDLIIRLLVNLTTPALLIYNEQLPADKGPRQNYLQIELHLQKYKRAFTNIKVWRIIANKLAEVIQAVNKIFFLNFILLYYLLVTVIGVSREG